jgi:hypothetical protein
MNCSVCQLLGHSRKAHRVACANCGKERFFYSLKEMESKKLNGRYFCDPCWANEVAEL